MLALNPSGELVVFEPSDKEFKKLASYKVADGETFAYPVASGDRLFISTQNSLSLNYLLEGTYHRKWLREEHWCGWDPTHVRFYRPGSLRRRLAQAGYRPTRWWGTFIVPYNILSWLVLLRRKIERSSLHKLDLALGGLFPFNRLGWSLMVLAERARA